MLRRKLKPLKIMPVRDRSVWLVTYQNNCVIRQFATREAAEKYLTDRGATFEVVDGQAAAIGVA